jgi:hypothetical protein
MENQHFRHIGSNKDTVMNSKDERRKTIAVDFDGVISEYDGWKGEDVLGPPREDVLCVLRTLRQEGWKIVIHTTRAECHILEYLSRNEVPYDEVNRNSSYSNQGPKPVATVYWDDRAVRYSGNAFQDIEAIRAFQTWNNRE